MFMKSDNDPEPVCWAQVPHGIVDANLPANTFVDVERNVTEQYDRYLSERSFHFFQLHGDDGDLRVGQLATKLGLLKCDDNSDGVPLAYGYRWVGNRPPFGKGTK